MGKIAYRRLYADDLTAAQAMMSSRNGIKYATVCESCNNERGAHDAAAADFVSQILSIERSSVYLPGVVHVPARANAVLRAVLAWFLTARLHEQESSTDAFMRAFLDGGELDSSITVYYWPYRVGETIIARDFTSFNVYDHTGIRGTASVVKFAPLAIMLVHGDPVLQALPRLDVYSGDAERSEMMLRWDRASAPPAHWPERPDDKGNIVMSGAEFINAVSSYSGFFGKAMLDEQRRRGSAIRASRGFNAPQQYTFVTDNGIRQRLYFAE